MQLTGRGVWGPPDDWDGAVSLLRYAYELGVRVFDTAWYYGPGVTHELIRQAFPSYPDDLVLVTKAGNSGARLPAASDEAAAILEATPPWAKSRST